MKALFDIKSKNYPLEIDEESSDTLVYVRSNIRELTESDPVFNTESKYFIYDEIQYTIAEWNRISHKKLREELKETKAKIEEMDIQLKKILKSIKQE